LRPQHGLDEGGNRQRDGEKDEGERRRARPLEGDHAVIDKADQHLRLRPAEQRHRDIGAQRQEEDEKRPRGDAGARQRQRDMEEGPDRAGAERLRRLVIGAVDGGERIGDRDDHVGQQDGEQADDHGIRGVEDGQRRIDDAGAAQRRAEHAAPPEQRHPAIGAHHVADHQREEQQDEAENAPARRHAGDREGGGIAEDERQAENDRRRPQRPQDDGGIEGIAQDRRIAGKADRRAVELALRGVVQADIEQIDERTDEKHQKDEERRQQQGRAGEPPHRSLGSGAGSPAAMSLLTRRTRIENDTPRLDDRIRAPQNRGNHERGDK
jgi:hypothetical protein